MAVWSKALPVATDCSCLSPLSELESHVRKLPVTYIVSISLSED